MDTSSKETIQYAISISHLRHSPLTSSIAIFFLQELTHNTRIKYRQVRDQSEATAPRNASNGVRQRERHCRSTDEIEKKFPL
jgi:hypothetical protein